MAKRATRGKYHGFVVVEKPAGVTSHDVVGAVRRMTGERRVGHAGTLDPAAVGVLPIAVGLATRTVEYLSESSKSYLAEVTFGVATDSLDGDGTLTDVADASRLTEADVRAALAAFRGDILQVPPMHSAIKIDGRPLYERARQGEHIELDARNVTIHELELTSWKEGVAELFIHCSKGTYVRSLARDLGEALSLPAYMSNLVRTSTGPFSLEDSWRLEELEELIANGYWEDIAAHPDAALWNRPAVVLSHDLASQWRNGSELELDVPESLVRVYDSLGTWIGVGRGLPERHVLKPEKVVTE
ncbi:MAG: tRNA pseudouridine(55) synthase TruB [Thermomicrobiales bacterium]|nr:tRNA pseudouridine(55) synthase TruB [Thermomicrobiales bacterium]